MYGISRRPGRPDIEAVGKGDLQGSVSTWTDAAVPKPSSARSNCSKMLRIWIMCTPPALGWPTVTISCPR